MLIVTFVMFFIYLYRLNNNIAFIAYTLLYQRFIAIDGHYYRVPLFPNNSAVLHHQATD